MTAVVFDDDGYDDETYDYDGCDHDDYDIDTIEGRCHCHRCGNSWYATDAEIQHAIDAEVAYANWQDEQNRREWWREKLDWLRSFIPRRKRPPRNLDDEIPF